MSLDPLVLQAEATAEAGNAVATWLLSKNGPSAVAGLTNLAQILPQIPLGKVTPFQLGATSAELSAINAQATAQSASQQLISQIGSLVSLVSSSQASSTGGPVTATQALLVGAAQNVALGIQNALGFFAGQQSVAAASSPAASPAASAPATKA
jgi:hypothetical protein